MKIFAVYLRFNLKIKPRWFDDLRAKYATRSVLHITLIQPRYIREDQIDDVRRRVEQTLRGVAFSLSDAAISFDSIELEKGKDQTYLVMWFIRRNAFVEKLQKELREALGSYGEYCDPATRSYESDFRPHMTVADQIVDGQEVLGLLSQDRRCEGKLTDLVLPVVKDMSVEESENVDNLTVSALI